MPSIRHIDALLGTAWAWDDDDDDETEARRSDEEPDRGAGDSLVHGGL